MSNQTFSVAGITVHNGNAKVRFTDDMARRVKQFTKGGATRCDFVDLPNEMTKVEALRYMLSHPDFQSDADQATLSDALADREKASGRGEVRVKNGPSLEAIRARGQNAETTVEDVLNSVAE
jgi:hypothetical protein